MTTRTTSVPGGLKAVVAVLFAALFFFGLQVPAAHASASVDVTISVATKAGTPLPGLNVYAYPVQNHAVIGDYIQAEYISGKQYRFSGNPGSAQLNSGTHYAFYFEAPATATTTFDQFWGGTTFLEEARYWDYGTDGTTLDVTLATNSTFTGKVTGTSSKPVAGVPVYPWRFDGNGWFRLDEAKTTTSSTGVYTMRDLEPGTYRLQFAPSNLSGYLSEFSGNTPVFASAAALNIGLGATVSYNAALAVGGSISGTVGLHDNTAPGTGAVQPYGITAYAYAIKPGGALDTDIAPFASRQTTSTGKWTIPGLPAGQYKVKLYDTYDPDAPVFLDKWSINADQSAAAKIYTVLAGKAITEPAVTTMPWYTDVADTSLELNVTDHNGAPASDATEVYIVSNTGEDFSAHFLLTGGTTYFPFLPVGGYDVFIDPHQPGEGSSITTQTIVSGTANTWDINLLAPSAFTYSTPATASPLSAQAGTQYTVDPGNTTLDDSSGTERPVDYSYIWLRDDAPIFGAQSATSDTYSSHGVDYGHQLSVIVRADSFGYAPLFTTIVLANPVTIGVAPVSTSVPTISGPAAPQPGSVLTANAGSWDQPGLTYGYQWFHDDGSGAVAIAGAVSRTYTVANAYAGEDVTVQVTATRTGYANSSPVTSPAPVHIGFLAAPKLVKGSVFSAVTLVGGDVKLTATSGTWSPAPTTVEYLWYVDGVVAPLTGPSVVCPAADCTGTSIELRVNAYRPGYTTASKQYVVRKGTAALVQTDAASVADMSAGGTPVVAGDPAQVGHTLKAIGQVYAYPHGAGTTTTSYQWYAGSAAIKGATKQTYVPTTASLNKAISVRIIVTSTLFPTGLAMVQAGTVRYLQNLVAGPQPSVAIDGTGLGGTVKRVLTTGSWPVASVTQSYQWWSCNSNTLDCSAFPSAAWIKIAKATASTYVPPFATTPPGTLLKAQVVGSKTGYQSFALVTPSFGITNSDLEDVESFTTPAYTSGLVGGNAVVGRAIVVKQGTLDRTANVTRTLKWQLCDDPSCSTTHVDIAGGATFVPGAALLADGNPHWIRFVEDISVNSHGRFSMLTATVPLVKGSWALVKAPVLTAAPDATPGNTRYTSGPGTWPAGVTPALEYKWYDGDSSTVVSTDPFYVVPTAPRTAVWVVVTAKRTGFVDLTYTLVARTGLLPAQTPLLSGSVYGDTLHVAAALNIPVNPGAASFSYQWYSGTAAIPKATAANFVPSYAYVGKSLKLRITVTSPYYLGPVTILSQPVVLAAHAAPSGTPAIVSTPGTFAPGAKLSVNTSTYPAGTTFTYTWQRSVDGIAPFVTIATTPTYTLTTADPSKVVQVIVKASRPGWLSSTLTAPVYVINYSAGLSLTTPFVLIGTGKVDGMLTATTTWNTTGMALGYSWTRNGVTIPGATGSTLTPTASWIGDEVQAHVTATKAGYLPVTVHSNEVQVAVAPAPTGTGLAVTPAHPHDSGPITVSPGVWNVGGLTFTYHWYEVNDVARTTELHTGATWTNVPVDTYTVWVDAARPGYATGHASIQVVVDP
ncbi:MAG: hypothetical protein JWP32_2315 [Schumannella sp.]|nr:hypothetical protein [Schumannella sp.]